MCGIFALHQPREHPSPDLVRTVLNTMLHRGPDAEGIYCRGPVALGHRRLSIIDLEGGDQPIWNEDNTLAIVCNGEIYDHLQLRRELEKRGHRFKTRSDSEVLLHLFEEKGPEAHGLCFSVKEGIPIPPSLRNILLEVNNSIYGGEKPSVGSDLTRWAEQGVLLLNASLTVIKKKPNSHSGLGWHAITDSIIETIAQHKTNVVFMLWGAFAQKKQAFIDPAKHCVLATSHPSPLSAHRGYLGSNIFAMCNDYLKANKKPEIIR